MDTMGICTGYVPYLPTVWGWPSILIKQEQSSVNSTIYGIDWVYKKNGQSHPSEHSVVRQVVEAARRILAKPKSCKVPLTVVQVRNILGHLEGGSLADLQVAAMVALCFYGFLQWDDLSCITPNSLVFLPTHVSIFLKRERTTSFVRDRRSLLRGRMGPPIPRGNH
jgi:hypothetical protein